MHGTKWNLDRKPTLLKLAFNSQNFFYDATSAEHFCAKAMASSEETATISIRYRLAGYDRGREQRKTESGIVHANYSVKNTSGQAGYVVVPFSLINIENASMSVSQMRKDKYKYGRGLDAFISSSYWI